MRPWIMFTKHLEGWDLEQIIDGLQRANVEGADLCVRPGYPVHPQNVRTALPAAAKRFAEEGLCIPLITTPGDFTDASSEYAQPLFEACAEAGVKLVKLGYWMMEEDGYWPTIDRCRQRLEGFVKLAEQTGVKPIIHNHSGSTMGLNSCSVMNIVKGFDPNLVGVFADVGHLSIVGEPYPMAFDIVKEYLAAVAFKDLVRKRQPNGNWTIDVWPLGMGFGNFPQVIKLLKDMDFTGPISFHCEYSHMPAESIIHQCNIDVRFIQGIVEALEG
ncbi:MAG: sugar phosphate isomerase/epimerase family protein [Candidatus Zipacnadales bacterium]